MDRKRKRCRILIGGNDDMQAGKQPEDVEERLSSQSWSEENEETRETDGNADGEDENPSHSLSHTNVDNEQNHEPRPISIRRRSKARPLTNYYEIFHENDQKQAICKLCALVEPPKTTILKMTDGNTSGVMRHLKKNHAVEYQEIYPAQAANL